MTFQPKHFLWLILFLALVLRLWGLGSMETFHDEGFYAFRSIGYVDYLQNDNQTTPIQWFRETALPWWTSLSFHDHPPLFFFIQNIFFRIFGDSLFAARLPSVVGGIISVFFVYILARQIFKSEYAGLFGALLLGISQVHIWISRSSLMESVLIAFILLNIYAFFRFLDDERKWPLFGITLGLIALTKYTGIFIVPVYITFLLISFIRPIGLISPIRFIKNWRLYAALGVALLLFSPVLIYNFYLYQATGHFDLQFAYLFGQETPEWQASLGKVQEPFSDVISNLTSVYSLPFLLVVLGGMFYSVYQTYKSYKSNWSDKSYQFYFFLWLVVIFLTLMLIAVGSAFRFLALYAIPFVFFALIFFHFLWKWLQKHLLFKILLIAFLAYEVFFAITGIFIYYPDYGIVKLDRYFANIFSNERPLSVPKSPNPHLDKIIQANLKKYPQGEEIVTLIYDENIALSPVLWVFARRLYYHGIPTMNAELFKAFLRSKEIEYFKDYTFYFVRPTAHTPLDRYFPTQGGFELERFLQQELGLSPVEIIYGYNNLPMFKIYKFLL